MTNDVDDDSGKTELTIEEIVSSPNVAELLSKSELSDIGSECVRGYLADKESRTEWEIRQADALKLALQVAEKKSFPWENASSVKFPLITIAAMQFHARAYPALIDSPNVVKTYIAGKDATGADTAKGERITSHMNYQLFVEDESWEEQMDRALLALPIAGCIFKKTYFDPVKGINRSVLVLPQDFVVDYWTKDINEVTRGTHVLRWNKNALIEKQRAGLFLSKDEDDEDSDDDVLSSPTQLPSQSVQEEARDKAQGTNDSGQDLDVYSILEQHCYLDLDGDGYKEPYIVFVREDTKQVLRIVARYFDQQDVTRANDAAIRRQEKIKSQIEIDDKILDKVKQLADVQKEIDSLRNDKKNKIVRIEAAQFFTMYTFIPSPDGGFYGIGYGSLLGPLSHAIDSIINQSIDAGTLSNLGGGFLGRGVKIKKGQDAFTPGEYKPIDSTGDDIHKNVFTFPFKGPSNELIQLCMYLVNYAERVSGSVDIMMGQNPGQNTPAETSRNMVEQGGKIFSGIYKRVYRSLKEELKKLYRLNQLFLEEDVHYLSLSTGEGAMISHDDYLTGSVHVIPEADPTIAGDGQKVTQAMALKQAAQSTPGYSLPAVERRFLKAIKIQNMEEVYPDPKGPNAIQPQPNMKLVIEQGKQQIKQQELQLAAKQFEFDVMTTKFELQQEVELQQAKIMKLQAETMKLLAEAKGVDTGHSIALINAQIGAERSHKESLLKALEIMSKHKTEQDKISMNGNKPQQEPQQQEVEQQPEQLNQQ
jgi:chaperonin GroES